MYTRGCYFFFGGGFLPSVLGFLASVFSSGFLPSALGFLASVFSSGFLPSVLGFFHDPGGHPLC